MAQTQVANYTMEAFVEDVNEVFRTIEDPHVQARTVSDHLEAVTYTHLTLPTILLV